VRRIKKDADSKERGKRTTKVGEANKHKNCVKLQSALVKQTPCARQEHKGKERRMTGEKTGTGEA